MSDSEDELPLQSRNLSNHSDDSDDDEEPSTSWGLKRRKRTVGIISDSENDDDDAAEDLIKDDADSCDSDSSGGAPGAETCAICLGRMRGEVGSPDSCEHTFCKFCILEWSKNNPTCPQDRKPFSEIVVRKNLDGPVEKRIPIKKREEEAVFDLVLENPTYCEVCNECDREERLLLCDGCDLGYHLECLDPPLSQVPVEEWFCPVCTAANVPEVLTNRRRSSASHPINHERRGSSSSGRPNQQPETPRIPRTRATERIRAHIQKKKIKKKLKRKRQKEIKKAKIESGEVEDRRQPVKSLNEFRMFDEEDHDIDAAYNDDRYADRLLGGAIVESYHHKATQRRADAVRRLRDVAFIPQASYSGRAKNRVMEIVNTQSDDNQSDLLSGILENQAIAFSSSKKLVLTNDRKLTKQPGIEINCRLFQEEDSFMPEPLPSQRKTPEESDAVGSSPDEKANPAISEEKVKEDTSVNKSIEDNHITSSQRSHSRSAHEHPADYRREWKKDYSHGSYKRDGSSSSRHGDYDRNRYQNQRHNDHHHSRHSFYDRQSSSSWYGRNSRDRSGYGRSERRSYDRHDSSERRFGNYRNRDRSPYSKNTSKEKESRENRWRSSVSRHDDFERNRAHSSKSRKAHTDSKGKSSLSSAHGKNHHRSQWSYNYFNSDNLFSRRSGDLTKADVKLSGSEGNTSKLLEVPKESSLDVGFADSCVIDSSCQKTEPNENHNNILSYSSNIVPPDSICSDKSSELHVAEESIVEVNSIEVEESSEYVNKVDKKCDVMSSQETPYGSNAHLNGTDRPSIQIKDNTATLSSESKNKEKSPFKSPSGKKTRMAFLFGDADGKGTEDPVTVKMDELGEDNKSKGKEKYQKSYQKVRSKHLLNEDIDDDVHLNASVKPEQETSSSRINLSIPKASKDKNMNANVESTCKGENGHPSTVNEEVSGKKYQEKLKLTDKDGKEVCEKFNNKKHASQSHSKENNEKYKGKKDKPSKHSREVSDISNNSQDGLHKNVEDLGENKCDNKKDASRKLGKEVDEKRTVKGDASDKGSKSDEKSHDRKHSSSKHSKETKEKSHDRKSTSGSHSLKGSECHSTDDVLKAHEKKTSETKPVCKNNVVPSMDKSSVTDLSRSNSESSDKKRKRETEATESNHSLKELSKYGHKKKNSRSTVFGDLFGDIDDIDSSSNSNFLELEVNPEADTSHRATLEAKEKPTAFKGVVCDVKAPLEVEQESECVNDLSSIQGFTDVEKKGNDTNRKDIVSGYSTSKHKPSLGSKLENDFRIKQQKASLEVKVVQEVKKSLDPYYRNKSITKDEYKQIVAKCVKKVVSAECGDVIEPEKMHGLVVGYVKVFRHRQMKSQI